MNSCGFNQNEISLDANEISNLVFSPDNIEQEYLDSLLNSFKSLDLKTYFEMLLIVTTEGLKKYYGDGEQRVDISNLNKDNIDLINSFLRKIKVELNVEIVSQFEWNFNENLRKTDFRKLVISNATKLYDLFFILERDAYVVISFKQLNL
jgi:hypothetical protein